jgi:hypothetical protein
MNLGRAIAAAVVGLPAGAAPRRVAARLTVPMGDPSFGPFPASGALLTPAPGPGSAS